MNKKTKFSKLVNEKIDSSKTYTIDEAVSIIMEFKRETFVDSVDVCLLYTSPSPRDRG